MDSSTVLPSPPAKRIPVLINREYGLLWAGQALSSLGDAVFATTLVLWIATRIAAGASWAPAAVGALVLAQTIPQILVGPLAGVFADRWPKKRTMLCMDMARAVLLGLLIVASIAPRVVPGVSPMAELLGAIYVTVVLVTVCTQLFLPSRLAVIRDIVPDQDRERASGLAQTSAAVTMIMGPAVAAPLFFALGTSGALTVDALSFLASFACILVVPMRTATSRREEGSTVMRELLDGLRVFRNSRILRVLLVTGTIFVLGEAALSTLSIFFLQQNLHASAHLFGLIGTGLGVGTLLGAAIAGPLATRVGSARALWMAAVAFGLLSIALSRLTLFPVALVLFGLTGTMFAIMEVAETPLLMRAAPPEYIGRVVAILLPAYSMSDTLSAIAAGWLASTLLRHFHATVLGMTLGPIDTIFAVAGLLAVCAGLYAMISLRVTDSGITHHDSAGSCQQTAEELSTVR